jgi:hypothetical protein
LNDGYYYYYGNSKQFFHADPNITDPHSIQYASCYSVYLLVKHRETEKWSFPYMNANTQTTMEFLRMELNERIFQNEMEVGYFCSYPIGTSRESFLDSELEKSPLLRRLKGRKVFYYDAFHDSGSFKLDNSQFSDFAWVTVPEMHKYPSPEEFNTVRPILTVY